MSWSTRSTLTSCFVLENGHMGTHLNVVTVQPPSLMRLFRLRRADSSVLPDQELDAP